LGLNSAASAGVAAANPNIDSHEIEVISQRASRMDASRTIVLYAKADSSHRYCQIRSDNV
jgi:hypothetical protein